jgi:hypothetical protein
MRRAISNTTALVAGMAAHKQSREIEAAGGFWAPEKPNREMRRRMQRAAKRDASAQAQQREGHPNA